MTGPTAPTLAAASGTHSKVTAFTAVAFYDQLRLSIYRERGPRRDCISIRTIGQSVALRFDDVGYFNSIYSTDDDLANQLGTIESFFQGSSHGCRLLAPSLGDDGTLATICRRRGWVAEESVAWLSGRPARVFHSTRLTIRAAHRGEAEAYFRTYLTAFDSHPDQVPGALENMQHLFDEPRLHFLLALDGSRPVGIGMLLHLGADALLCAGAMLPSHRGLGGHQALIAHRLRLAHLLGCTAVHSWAVRGGQSHAHLERFGLRTESVTRTWRWSATR